MGFTGKLNIYTCDTCRGHIVTRDVDEGVTPFMTNCRASPDCSGTMKSSMYRVFDQSMAESHQWYQPEREAWGTYPKHTRDHLERGGLLLKEATEPVPYVDPDDAFVPPKGADNVLTSKELIRRGNEMRAKLAEAELAGSLDERAQKIAALEKDVLNRQQRRAAEREAQKAGRKGIA